MPIYTRPSTGGGTASITEVLTYADFVAGTDGDIGKTTSDGRYWVFNGATGLWLQPEVQPLALEVDYDGSVVPTAAVPAWTSDGGIGSSSDGDILTINDNSGAGYQVYKIIDGDLLSAGNCGVIMRARVLSQSPATIGYKAMLALRAGSLNAGAIAIAYGASGGASNNLQAISTAFGNPIGTASDVSPDNTQWQDYFIYYFADQNKYVMGALSSEASFFAAQEKAFSVSYLNPSSVLFGCYSTPEQAYLEVDFIKAFTF